MSKFLTFNLGFSNVFLLQTSEGYILIDTFYKSVLKRFKKKLKKSKIEPEEIKLIIITHTHGDHTGCIKEVQQMTKAKVLVHENEKEFLMKGTTPEVVPVSKTLKLLLPLMPEKENKYEIFSQIKEENIKKKIHAQASVDNMNNKGKGKGNGKWD